jgi:RNA polymerase sigma-70 factor, ECF subfamily
MTWTDEELVARSRGGDVDSFNQLILRWERPIYALAFRVIGREDDARDVCQEAFLRAFRALPGFKGQAKFSSWLYRITLNLCRDWMRKQRRAPTCRRCPRGSDREMAAESGRHRVDRGTGRAPRTERRGRTGDGEPAGGAADAIVLKEYHGMTFQEIADLQGCPLSTVKTRLYQGLAALRRQLERSGHMQPPMAKQ